MELDLGSKSVKLRGAIIPLTEIVQWIRVGVPVATQLVVDELIRDRQVESGAFAALYVIDKAFRDRMVGYLVKRWFEKDRGLADEAWNDTLFRVYSQIDSYDETTCSFRTWVFNQARWAALDVQRRECRARMVVVEALPDEEDRTQAPKEPLTDREIRALRRAHERLTLTERTLLALRYVGDYTYEEIARDERLAGIPEEHLRVYVMRAKKRLRQYFDDEIGPVRDS